jgi:periplasmic protein TonB
MFEDATFESTHALRDKSRQWMLLTLALNLSLAAALILVPLIHPDTLPSSVLSHILLTPPPPAQITPALSHPQPVSSHPLIIVHDPYLVPTTIPTHISPDPGPPSSATIDLSSSTSGTGVAGSDGIPGIFVPPTFPRVVHPAPAAKPVISQGVAAGLLIQKTIPTYPALAKAMRVAGTVMLAATISKSGAIQGLRVLSGPPGLRAAATDAVQTWRYHPYLLNGQPVDVDTTINVVFSLGQ